MGYFAVLFGDTAAPIAVSAVSIGFQAFPIQLESPDSLLERLNRLMERVVWLLEGLIFVIGTPDSLIGMRCFTFESMDFACHRDTELAFRNKEIGARTAR